MSRSLKFAFWADIHHSYQASKCLTLEDTVKIEKSIFDYSIANNFDFVLFGGDRFLNREPKDEVKTQTDRIYKDFSKSGILSYHLIGNHDWTTNAMQWHTSMSIGDLPNVILMDYPNTYLGPDGKGFRIHSLPANFAFNKDFFSIDKSDLNIFVFHDILTGSYRNDDRSPNNVFKDGKISLEDIDDPDFDFILAGDIHVPQRFNLKNVKGWGYVGSTLQRNRGEANHDRGWLEVEAHYNGVEWDFDVKFHKSRNFFSRYTFNVSSESTYEGISRRIPEDSVEDQLLEIKLIGSKADVDRIADNDKWSNFEDLCMARRVEIVRAYEAVKNEVSIDMTSSNSLSDDLGLYLDSGFANIGNLKSKDLFKFLKDLDNSS